MNKTKILVDTSYLVYYNSFACWSWWKNEFGTSGIPKDGTFDPMTDPEFASMFENRFMFRITNAIKKHIIFFNKNDMDIIFCKDCHRKDIWRNDLFPEYKMNRKQNQEDVREFSYSGIFNYVNDILIPNLCEQFGYETYQHPSCEGDDIIAILTDYYHNKGYNKNEIIILSCDGDLTQLTDRATQVTIKCEQKTIESVMKKFRWKDEDVSTWNSNKFIVHKSLIGDKGDEIPPVKKGIGPKKALNIMNDPDKFKEFLSESEHKERFKRNMSIIDLKNIPKLLVNEVLAMVEQTTEGLNAL